MAPRTIDEPKTPGQRIRALRKSFGLSEDVMANLVKMSRTNVVRLEKDKTKWTGRAPESYAQALGMTYEQFKEFRDGVLLMPRACRLAEPILKAAADAEKLRAERSAILDDAIEIARAREPVSESYRAMLYELFEEHVGWDISESAMVEQIISTHRALSEAARRSVRTSKSHRLPPK